MKIGLKRVTFALFLLAVFSFWQSYNLMGMIFAVLALGGFLCFVPTSLFPISMLDDRPKSEILREETQKALKKEKEQKAK